MASLWNYFTQTAQNIYNKIPQSVKSSVSWFRDISLQTGTAGYMLYVLIDMIRRTFGENVILVSGLAYAYWGINIPLMGLGGYEGYLRRKVASKAQSSDNTLVAEKSYSFNSLLLTLGPSIRTASISTGLYFASGASGWFIVSNRKNSGTPDTATITVLSLLGIMSIGGATYLVAKNMQRVFLLQKFDSELKQVNSKGEHTGSLYIDITKYLTEKTTKKPSNEVTVALGHVLQLGIPGVPDSLTQLLGTLPRPWMDTSVRIGSLAAFASGNTYMYYLLLSFIVPELHNNNLALGLFVLPTLLFGGGG